MNKKISALLVVALLALTLLGGCLRKNTGTTSGPVTLTVYGLDTPAAFASVISNYKKRQPQVTVKYKQFSDPSSFENLVVNDAFLFPVQCRSIFVLRHEFWHELFPD